MKYTSEQVSQAWRSYVASRHSSVQRKQLGGQVADAKTFANKHNTIGDRNMDLKLPKITDPNNKKFTYSGDIIDLGTDKYKSLDADYNGKNLSLYAGTAFPYKTQNDKSLFNPYIGASYSLGNFDVGAEYDAADKTMNANVDYNLNKGGRVKHKLKHKKEQKEIASADAQVEHGHSSASMTQHRAGGGIIEGKPGIDTNDAKLRPGSFVIPKKKVPHAIKDGILRPKQAEKFQEGGVPVKLTAGEGLLSPEKAARLHAEGVDLNEYAPDTEFPYQPDSLIGMQYGGGVKAPGEVNKTSLNTDSTPNGGRIIIPAKQLYEMGSHSGTGIDVHGKDTTMTFDTGGHKKMTWVIKNKQGIYDPHASLNAGTMGRNEGGGIHIKKANRGKFTAYKERTGKTTEEALHSSDPHVRKMAQFAKNAKKWKHDDGGEIKEMQDGGSLYKPRNKEAEYEAKRNLQSTPTPEKTIVPVKPTKRLATKNKPVGNKDTRTDAEKQKQTQSDFDAMVKRNVIGKPHGAGGSWTPEEPSFIRDFGEATMNDLGYLGDAWNAVGQAMYSAGKGAWDGLGWLNKKLGSGVEPQKKNKGGKIGMQQGGGVGAPYVDPMSNQSLDPTKDESDPFFRTGTGQAGSFTPDTPSKNLLGLNNSFPQSFKPIDPNAKTPSLLNTPFKPDPTIPVPVGGNITNTFKDNGINFNRKQETAADNSKRLQQSIVGNNATQITDNPQKPTNSLIDSNSGASNTLYTSNGTKQPLSLFDQARKDEKRYTDITTAEDLALLAGNLGSRYHPTPRPVAYTPDIYERNTNAEAIEQGKNLDKEAATARYNARNTGQGRVSDPAITANLMDKRLALGAATDTTKENERKSVYEQRNQASLMNLNQNNQYNTMEANRLDQFRAQKGQESMKMVDRLQDVYKSSIEDKYALLGAENQSKIAQEQAKNQFFASFGTTPSQAMQAKFDGDYSDWVKDNPSPKPDDIKKFIDDWKTKNPQQ